MSARTHPEIGSRRARLVIEAPAPVADGAGGAAEGFAPSGAVWASLRWLGGEERRVADRPEQAGRYEITLRWRAGVSAGMRLRLGERVFGIVAAGDPVGNRTRLVCHCEEITP